MELEDPRRNGDKDALRVLGRKDSLTGDKDPTESFSSFSRTGDLDEIRFGEFENVRTGERDEAADRLPMLMELDPCRVNDPDTFRIGEFETCRTGDRDGSGERDPTEWVSTPMDPEDLGPPGVIGGSG